jgi:plasmid stabilization system protein ParE
MTGFVLHPESYRDIQDIWEYIAVDNILAADRTVEEIYKTIQRLVPFPDRGHARPDLTSRPVRFQDCTRVRDCICARREAAPSHRGAPR